MNLRSRKVKLALVATLTCLAVAAAAYAGEGGEAHHGLVNHRMLVDFGWRCLNFAVLVVILVKYLIPPIGKLLSDRRMAIVNQFEDLRERRAEVEESYKECEVKLSNIGQEVDNILKAAKAQAEAEKTRIIEEARRNAEDIKRKAAASVQNELSRAQRKLREDVAEQAAALAAEIIKKDFTAADQTKVVEDYLEQVGAMA
jgi:F-type H+-transporting ATPase subunit b